MDTETEIHVEVTPHGKRHRVSIRVAGKLVAVDTITVGSRKVREAFCDSVVEKLPAIDREHLSQILMEKAVFIAQTSENAETQVDPLDATDPAVIREAEALLADPALIGKVADDLTSIGISGERDLAVCLYLVGTSRLLSAPLSAIVRGSSSSGKSYTLEKTAELFPTEAVIFAKQMTPQSLFHMPEGSLRHRWIVAGERSRKEDDSTAEATRALREMLSSGKLSKMMPMKSGQTIETRLIEQEGPIAFCETTTLGQIFDEDASRCILLSTDETQAQTFRIMRSLALRHTTEKTDVAAIELLHQTLQRLLPTGVTVKVPYADRLAERFPAHRVEARRAFPQLLGFVQASALLHFRQRKRDTDGSILADANDYRLAHHLLSGPFSQSMGGSPTKAALDFWRDLPRDDSFTNRTESKRQSKPLSSVKSWLAQLEDFGLVSRGAEARGRKPTEWRKAETRVEVASFLPAPEIIFVAASSVATGHNAQNP